MKLGDLFDKYGSDKGSGVGMRHGYHEFYESIVSRDTPLVVEIGLGSNIGFDGSWGSARAWLDWLSGGIYHGFDLVEPPAEILERGNFRFTQGDQSVRKDLERLADLIEGADVIIDDGSHVAEHQLLTLDVLWPRLRPGGYYVVEDLYQHQSCQSLIRDSRCVFVVGQGQAAVLRKGGGK